jgi:mRNA-degrading endonuclease RelE of RelBE toxin-antitoxin system
LTKGTQAVTYDWSEEKNGLLKKQQSISFEEIVLCIQEGRIVAVLEHPNKEKYPNQQLYLIRYREQIFVVPFVIDEEEEIIFLKTIYPSRQYTKKYLERKNETNKR